MRGPTRVTTQGAVWRGVPSDQRLAGQPGPGVSHPVPQLDDEFPRLGLHADRAPGIRRGSRRGVLRGEALDRVSGWREKWRDPVESLLVLNLDGEFPQPGVGGILPARPLMRLETGTVRRAPLSRTCPEVLGWPRPLAPSGRGSGSPLCSVGSSGHAPGYPRTGSGRRRRGLARESGRVPGAPACCRWRGSAVHLRLWHPDGCAEQMDCATAGLAMRRPELGAGFQIPSPSPSAVVLVGVVAL